MSGLHADTSADHQRHRNLLQRRLPVVFVNGYAVGVEAPFASDDDVEAMDLAVTHLVQLGHRKIGLAVGQERFVPVQRKRVRFVAWPPPAGCWAWPTRRRSAGWSSRCSPSRVAWRRAAS